MRKILSELIKNHGVSNNINNFEALLRQKCGNQYQREIFMLCQAVRENILIDLLNPPENITETALLSNLTQRLYEKLGFDKELAEWTVQTWNLALNQTKLTQNSQNDKTTDLELTEEFSKAYDLMEYSKNCVFITGKAGTGKSTLLQYFKKRTQKKVVILAPTGVAALNVGGSTLHSFFRLPPRPLQDNEIKTVSGKRSKLYKSLETIIIDEVSMVRADMMDVIDKFMRLNSKTPAKPFGGVKMIFIGDLFQLPPVVSNNEEAQLFSTNYKSPFFFSAKVFDELKIDLIELTKVFRQKAQTFINLLNSIRNNQATQNEIQQINQRYQPQFDAKLEDYYITLATTNKIAAEINAAQLEKLATKMCTFQGKITGKFDKSSLPTDLDLTLKSGAQVMFVKNDSDGRWVNGTIGKIKSIKKDKIEIEMPNKITYTIKPVKWEIPNYTFDAKNKVVTTEVIGSFTQYPLKLAWAITIHKSQGKQFDKVIIDLGWGTFAHGQLYVALSRCKTMEGLILKKPIRLKDVIVDRRVIEFFSLGFSNNTNSVLRGDNNA
jgi:ATP-dependent exoDNAse (exonuclease V) alpha subunit